jgi:hypothetical protein
MLSGLIIVARGCPAMQFTTGRLEAPDLRSSRTQRSFLSIGTIPRRYYRTVSRRTEPSSCGILMDEQPNPWPLLCHASACKSGFRVSTRPGYPKPTAMYQTAGSICTRVVRVLVKRQNYIAVYSHPRRACYLQGSLSDSLNPHQRDFKVRYTRLSSLHSTLLRIQSAQHLLLTLYFRFLTGMS